MKVKNIILYIVGILCCIGALALFVWGGFVPERQTATLLLVFLLGFTAVAVMDLIDDPEVIFIISHRRLRKGIEKDKLLPGKYWCKKGKKYIGAIVDLRGDVHLESFDDKKAMKEWLGRREKSRNEADHF